MTDSASQTSCPDCGTKGRKVKRLTPESLLTVAAKRRLNGNTDFRFCKNEECDVVYFGGNAENRFVTADLSVPVFQKSKAASRLVCHCFEHSVQSIGDEVARDGASNVSDSIGAKCKSGLDRCEVMNPQGSCCLGNVRQVVKAAMAVQGASLGQNAPQEALADCCTAVKEDASETAQDDCCAPERSADAEHVVANAADSRGLGNKVDRAGIWSAGGAMVAALLSSACCWLPLALIGFGASAAGVAGFFEEFRFLFLGLTAVLLGAGFYYVYLRELKCAPGEACAVPNPKLQRMNKITLWISTAFVVAFAAFPEYIGGLVGGDDEPPPLTDASAQTRASSPNRTQN